MTTLPRLLATCALATALVGGAAGCGDPLKDGIIAELGEEQAGFAPSPEHRTGQPCLACHSEYGGAEPEMAVAGTLFAEPVDGEPLRAAPGFTVRIIDSTGQIVNMPSNRCGNFYISAAEFQPAYPLRAEVWGPSPADPTRLTQLQVMSTRIGRDGSCGSCHIHPASPETPGTVFIAQDTLDAVGTEVPDPLSCPTPRFAGTILNPAQP